jgi:hypothetical protein
METLSILDEDQNIITLYISYSKTLKPTEGYFNVSENQILLGKDRYEEWLDIVGNNIKQKSFINSLIKVYRKGLKY